jgi:LmbE family N-acetylglucosaminyl deacetylase
MKPIFNVSAFFVVMLFLGVISAHLYYLTTLRATETYPQDTFLASIKNKKALIVTAHDDDAFAMAGTINRLVEEGWEIRQICFSAQQGRKRDEIFEKIAKKQGLLGVDFLHIKHRNDLDTNKTPFMPIAIKNFSLIFNTDSTYTALAEKIDQFQPEVIFSLDDQIGGYGHPDHVFISRLVIDYCKKNQQKAGFSVKRIYQAVYPPSMSEAINVKERLHNWSSMNPYLAGKAIYNVDGMPVPDVEIKIYEWANEKKMYMESFPPQDLRSIKKVAPAFHLYPAWIYFKIFDKEYFRVIANG